MESSNIPQNVKSDQVSIKIDLTMVNSNIKTKGSYNSDKLGVFIESNSYKNGIGSAEKYLASISAKDKFTYVGTLNDNLKRSGIGMNKYNCGDSYFGYWQNDKKFLSGVYAHKPENDQSEFYAGNWEDAKRNGFGVYVWKKDNQPENKAIMDVFIGNFKDGAISRGLYVSRQLEGDNVKSNYYFGKFLNGKKSDENALYYLTTPETLFQGQIENDNLIKGNIYHGKDNRAFSFVKHSSGEYLPDEVTEEKANEVKKIYEAFNNFNKIEKIKIVLTGLVKKINELTAAYSGIEKYKTGEVDLLKLLELETYNGIFNEFNKLADQAPNSSNVPKQAQPEQSNNLIQINKKDEAKSEGQDQEVDQSNQNDQGERKGSQEITYEDKKKNKRRNK
jgi:hypothetical protein